MFLDATSEEECLTANRMILAYTHSGRKLTNIIQAGIKSEIGFDMVKRMIKACHSFCFGSS